MGTPLDTYLGIKSADAARYQVKAELAHGSMGVVLAGYDSKLKKDVAIKVMLLANEEQRATWSKLMNREARVIAALKHPNIVQVLDYSGPDDPQPYIVMERLRGRRVAAPMGEANAIRVGASVARALAHAHSKGIFHREVQPENIHEEPDGRIVLLDFGISKGPKDFTFGGGTTDIVGTPLFSSPEQVLGSGEYTGASDVFALGATLYYLVSKRFPYNAARLADLVRRMREDEATPLNAPISMAFRAAIMKAIRRDPEQRFKSASEFAAALEALDLARPFAAPELSLRRYIGPAIVAAAGIALSGLIWSRAFNVRPAQRVEEMPPPLARPLPEPGK